MTKNKEMIIEWPHFGEAASRNFWAFFNSDEFTDVILVTADGKQIKCHRILLAVCSEYFYKLFKSQTIPDTHIVCVNLHSKILLKTIALMYTGIVKVPSKDIGAFAKAAKFLKINGFDNIGEDDFKDAIKVVAEPTHLI